MRSTILAGLGLMLTAAVAGCGSAAAPGPPRPAGPHTPVATRASNPGVTAKSLSCNGFPADPVQAAVRGPVPSAVVRADGPSTDTSRPDSLICRYTLYTPGTDLESADRGLIQVALTISDQWTDAPHLDDGKDGQRERDAFEENKASALNKDGHTANDTTTYAVHEVPATGAGAYLEDATHREDGTTVSQYSDDLSILHDPGPYKVEVSVSYVLPQADQPLPDTALDTAMRDAAGRTRLAQAIAGSLLTRIGSA